MNCKKYRICLLCLVAAVLVFGAVFLMLRGKKEQVPADAMLVKHYERTEPEDEEEVNGGFLNEGDIWV